MWTEEKKETFWEAMRVLPVEIQESLYKTVVRQAEVYRAENSRPGLRLVVNGVAVQRRR